jgi:hypothetical protein
MATKWQRTKVSISDSLKPKERIAISDAIIEYIKQRTLDGLDKNLEPFNKYTKAYADFKGVGVNDVDLTFSSEMLSDLKLLSHKKGEVIIGYEKGSLSNGKADGNIRGTYGKPFPVTKGRDFLGISQEELEILEDTITALIPTDDIKGLTDDEIESLARDAAIEILGNIF